VLPAAGTVHVSVAVPIPGVPTKSPGGFNITGTYGSPNILIFGTFVATAKATGRLLGSYGDTGVSLLTHITLLFAGAAPAE
jgi:hypothetical protein